jgi:hypothetical protein
MKLLTEYLDRAVSLERLAVSEADSNFKAELLIRRRPIGSWQPNAPKNTAYRLPASQKFQLRPETGR